MLRSSWNSPRRSPYDYRIIGRVDDLCTEKNGENYWISRLKCNHYDCMGYSAAFLLIALKTLRSNLAGCKAGDSVNLSAMRTRMWLVTCGERSQLVDLPIHRTFDFARARVYFRIFITQTFIFKHVILTASAVNIYI